MHRLYCIYSTEERSPGEPGRPSRAPETTGSFTTPGEFLERFGDRSADQRMEAAYRSAAAQMPTVLDRRSVSTVRLLTEAGEGRLLSDSPDNDLAVLRLPYGGLVVCLTMHLPGDLDTLVEVLRATTFAWERLTLDGADLVSAATGMEGARSAMELVQVGSDVHHVVRVDPSALEVFVDRPGEGQPTDGCPADVDRQVVTRLVVRSTMPMRLDFSEVEFPIGTNRVVGTLAAVGPNVTVLAGQPVHVEGWILWSAIQLTCSFSRVRQIRREAYETLDEMERGLRAEREHRGDYSLAREHLASLSRRLGRLELELAYGVQAYVDVQFVLPSPMLAHFHRAAASLMGIVNGVSVTADLLDRAAKAISARRDIIRSAERVADEVRIQRVTVAAAVFSVVALVSGVFFGFFGSNVSPVDPARPTYFSGAYVAFYVGLAGFLTVLVITYYVVKRRYPMKIDTQELLTWGIVSEPGGGARPTSRDR